MMAYGKPVVLVLADTRFPDLSNSGRSFTNPIIEYKRPFLNGETDESIWITKSIIYDINEHFEMLHNVNKSLMLNYLEGSEINRLKLTDFFLFLFAQSHAIK